jgi:sugar transferase (PEP-CTERM/EpsH1 system associated)
MPHLLYLTHRIPYPPNKGDKLRSYHLLEYLSEHYRIHLGTFVDVVEDWQYVDTVRRFCAETYFAGLNPRWARLKSLSGVVTGEPLTLPYYRHTGLQRWVRRVLSQHPVRHVLVFSSAMAQYVGHVRHVRRVADFVDVDSDKWRQYAASKPWPLGALYRREARLLLDYERAVTGAFDATVLVSRTESEMFRRLAPEHAQKIEHVNNGVDCEYFSPELEFGNPYGATDRVLVFTGAMDYWPNIDAAQWFAREVFPHVRARYAAAQFFIVGARPTPAVKKLAQTAGVTVTGSVPDVRPYLAHAAIALAPLRVARGVQNKVLEAMAMARPVVASPQAAAGVEAVVGRELLVADGATAYVDTLCALLDKADLRVLARAGRERVLTDYSWTRNLGRIDRLLQGAPSIVQTDRVEDFSFDEGM